MTIQFEFDEDPLSQDKLERLAKLALHQMVLEDQLEELDATRKLVAADLDKVSGSDIPDLLAETGLSEVRLADGTKVKVREDYKVGGTTGKYRDAINDWCLSSGHDDVVKHEIKAQLGAGDEETARQAMAALDALGVPATDQMAVNPQTLKALVRELVDAGESVPLEELGVFTYRQTKLERPA